MAAKGGDDSDEEYTTPIEETVEAIKFVNDCISVQAQRDIQCNRNIDVAQDIVNKVKESDCSDKTTVEKLVNIADIMNQDVSDQIDGLVKVAQEDGIVDNLVNGYNQFMSIAQGIFDGGFTVERLMVLIIFGYRWIVASYRNSTGALATIVRYLVKFLSSGAALAWLSRHGGLAAVRHTMSNWVTCFFIMAAIGFVCLAYVFKK